MQAEPARQFPNALDRVQVWAVGRQIAQREIGLLFGPPRGVQFGVVIFCVVDDHHHAPPRAPAALPQLGQKIPGRHSVKAASFATEEELAIPQADGSEITNAFARGRVEQNWIGDFRGNPQTAPGTMLLEMDFIDGPQVNLRIERQGAEFFYARLVFADRLAPPPGAACGSGSPIGERAADIAEL